MTKPAPPARRSTESFDTNARLSSVPAATGKKVPRVRQIDGIVIRERAQPLHDVVAASREKLEVTLFVYHSLPLLSLKCFLCTAEPTTTTDNCLSQRWS